MIDFLLPPSLALAIGVMSCIIIGLVSGAGPLAVISAIWQGAWGTGEAALTSITKITPLLMTALSVTVAYQARLLNIGCEGQLTVGALVGASFAIYTKSLPGPLIMVLSLMVSAVSGGLWALPAIWLRQKRGVHEVISTLLLNYLAIYLVDYLVMGPLGDGTTLGRTPEVPSEAVLPTIVQSGIHKVTVAPFLAVLTSVGMQIWLSKTVWGFELRAVGSNKEAARAAGIDVEVWQRRIFIVSGALAGLAGGLEIFTVHHRFYRAFSPGYGFDGITAAFLAGCIPGLLWATSALLAGLRSADKWLQLTVGISPSAIQIIQAVLLLCVASKDAWGFFRIGKRRL